MSRNRMIDNGTAPESAAGKKGVVRCAIYTRKSTDEGLEQEFNSLDAQRESAEASRIDLTTAVSPEAIWSAPPSKGFSPASIPAT
jgi:hypothetical protein